MKMISRNLDNTPPTVLLIGNFLSAMNRGRGVCEDLAVRLTDADWRVLTASSKTTRFGRLSDMLQIAWRRRRQYRVASVEVYSGRAFRWAEAVCKMLRVLDKPYVLTLHGGNLPQFAARRPRRMRRLLRSAHAVTVPSPYLREQMRPYREDLRLLPNPLDVGRYRYTVRSNPQSRLVWLRSFHSLYNPSLAPRVLAILSREFPQVGLVMVGPDRGDGSLQATRRTAADLGVLDRITFPGSVSKGDVPAWLSRGDVFLNTTNYDNTPVSVLEAMACGLCLVSTDAGGVPYLIDDGVDGLLSPRDDPQRMAAAVTRILREPALAERLSRNARAKAESCDWSAILPRWQSLLTEAALSQGRAARA
jgi:glycosyltransferase involved in cell wall biosynthesis